MSNPHNNAENLSPRDRGELSIEADMLERVVSDAVAGAAQALAEAVREAQKEQAYAPAAHYSEYNGVQSEVAPAEAVGATEAQVPYRASGTAADSFLEGLEHAAAEDTDPVATAQIMAASPATASVASENYATQPYVDPATAAHLANMDAQLESLWAEPAVASDAEERAVRIAAQQAALSDVYDERDKQREAEAMAARQERQRTLLEQYPQYNPGFAPDAAAQAYAEPYVQPYNAPQIVSEEGAAA